MKDELILTVFTCEGNLIIFKDFSLTITIFKPIKGV